MNIRGHPKMSTGKFWLITGRHFFPKMSTGNFLCYLKYFMRCCIKYHDIAVQYDEKYNFLILLVVLCYLLVVLCYLKYFTSCCIKYHDEKSNFLISFKIFHELLYQVP